MNKIFNLKNLLPRYKRWQLKWEVNSHGTCAYTPIGNYCIYQSYTGEFYFIECSINCDRKELKNCATREEALELANNHYKQLLQKLNI